MGGSSDIVVFEFNIAFALGSFRVVDQFRLTLVIPTLYESIFTDRQFEIAIQNGGVCRVGLNLPQRFSSTGHGHEERGSKDFRFKLSISFSKQVQALLVTFSHWNDHQPTFCKLVDQGLWDALGRTRGDDLVERRVFRPPLEPIAHADMDIVVVESFECFRRVPSQFFDNFNRVDLIDDFPEDGRLITTSGSNFQDSVRRLRVQTFGHIRNDEWGGDGLCLSNCDRRIVIRLFAIL